MPSSDENWTWQCDRVIPTDPTAARRLVEELLKHLRRLHWGNREIFGIHVAVDEAMVNAILHGNRLDISKHVHFCCWLSPTKIRVEITDEGQGFNPEGLADPTRAENIDAPSGRGVMLMRSFMSRVEFHDRGNHVVLEKTRDDASSCESP
jgi:serine/threonine-protein kinase RsbW